MKTLSLNRGLCSQLGSIHRTDDTQSSKSCDLGHRTVQRGRERLTANTRWHALLEIGQPNGTLFDQHAVGVWTSKSAQFERKARKKFGCLRNISPGAAMKH
jgi:hypothetical protein